MTIYLIIQAQKHLIQKPKIKLVNLKDQPKF